MNSTKAEKPFSMRSMIASEVLLLWVTLLIGDFLMVATKLPLVLTRYIPICVLSIAFTYYWVKKGAKRCLKSEQENFFKIIIIVPIIVAIILFVYGLVSVNRNVSKLEKEYKKMYSLYSSYYGNSSTLNQMIEKAKTDAIVAWIITSVIYLGVSEATTVYAKKRVYDLFIDDATGNTEVITRMQTIPGQAEPNHETDGNINNTTENINETNNNLSEDNNNDTIKKINWDL